MAAHVLDFEFELVLRALVGALSQTSEPQANPATPALNAANATTSCVQVYLESEVLEEVSGSVGGLSLGSGAGIDKDTDGGRLGVGRVLSGDLDPGDQFGGQGQARAAFGHTVRPFLRVVDWVMLWAAATEARVRVNFLGRAFRRSWAERAFLATRAAAIVSTTSGRWRRAGVVLGWGGGAGGGGEWDLKVVSGRAVRGRWDPKTRDWSRAGDDAAGVGRGTGCYGGDVIGWCVSQRLD